MEENSISVIIVNPRNDRLYNYWINGSLEKRCMLKDRMREFCLDLSPANARDINRCIDDMIPFVVYVDQKVFQELEEEAPPKVPKASRLFPLRKKELYQGGSQGEFVEPDTTDFTKEGDRPKSMAKKKKPTHNLRPQGQLKKKKKK